MWPFRAEKRSAGTTSTEVATSDPFLGSFLSARMGRASVEQASGLAVAHRCVSLISETLSMVPLKVYERTEDGGRKVARNHPLYRVLQEMATPGMSAFEAREWLLTSVLIFGDGYARIVRDGRGQVTELQPLKFGDVTVEKLKSGRLRYRVSQTDGGTETLLQEEMLHIRYRTRNGINGASPIAIAQQAFDLAVAQQDTAGAAAENSFRPAGALVFPDKLKGEQKDGIVEKFKARLVGQLKANELIVLDGGMKFEAIQFNSKDSEFLDSRKLSNLEICRVYGVPPSAAGINDGVTYNGIWAESEALVMRCLAPMAKRIESAMMIQLLSDDSRKRFYIEHELDGLARGDLKTRYEAYRIGRDGGWLSADEIRGMENMSKIEGGDTYLQPLNMAELGSTTEAVQ